MAEPQLEGLEGGLEPEAPQEATDAVLDRSIASLAVKADMADDAEVAKDFAQAAWFAAQALDLWRKPEVDAAEDMREAQIEAAQSEQEAEQKLREIVVDRDAEGNLIALKERFAQRPNNQKEDEG